MRRTIPAAFLLSLLIGYLAGSTVKPPVAEAAVSATARANHITNVRAVLASIINADINATAVINEANDLAFLTGGGNAIVDGDFTGANAGVTAADYNTAMTQLTNWHNAISLGVNVGGNSASTLPSGLRAVFQRVAR